MSDDAKEKFLKNLELEEPVSPKVFAESVASAIKDRALLFYFVWKTLQELHPEIDADEVMAEASRRLGAYKAPNLGEVKDAKDAMLNQTSKGGMLAFDQELTTISPEFSEKLIRRCPHIDAFHELGCSDEECAKLCTKLLMPLDFAILSPYPNVSLSFPKNLAEDDVCIMQTRKVK